MVRRLSNVPSMLVVFFLFAQLALPAGNVFASMLPPSNLAAQFVTPDDVKLTWSAVTGATGYKVYEITEGQLIAHGTTTTSSYPVNNLPEGSYSYVVSTLNAEGESGPSAPVNVEIVYPDMAAPASLSHAIKSGNDIVLSWTASQYAEGYNIYRIDGEGQKALVSFSTGRTYTISDVPEHFYIYAVSSVHSLYGESPLSSPVEIEMIHPTMAAPSNFSYTVTNGSDVNLKWNAANFATAYRIYQVVDGGKDLLSNVTSTSAKLSNVPAGDYVYEIHSYSDRFGESPEGSLLSVAVSDVVMAAPGNLTYKLQNGNDIVLNWDSVFNAMNYNIYRIIDDEQELKSTVIKTTATYTNMAAGKYTFIVYSNSDRFGESAEGSQVSVTVNEIILEAPSGLSYHIQNGNDIVLNWESEVNANGYKVYQIINGEKVLKSTVTGTTVKYANMPAGDYKFEVYSYSTRFGESPEGSSISFALAHPTMQAPENLTPTVKSATSFGLSWSASEYANQYKIYQIIDGNKVLKTTLSGTSYTYFNVQPGEYSYEVHSYSSRFGESPEGSRIKVIMNGQTMETPSNLDYSILNGNDIRLNWTGVTYATNYSIYQVIEGEKVLKSTVTSPSVTFANLPEAEYTYIVHSFSSLLGESPEGAEVQIALVYPTMVAPDNLAYKVINGNDVVLSWTRAPHASSYNVYEVVEGQKVFEKTVTSLNATLLKVSVGEHTYVVHAVSPRFGESGEGSAITLTMQEQTMQAPANLTHSVLNGNDIRLNWSAVTNASAYRIYRIIDGKSILERTVTGTNTTFTNLPEGEYSYQVYSYSERFGESPEGSGLSLSLAHPTMQAPENVRHSIINGNDISLSWNIAAYANSYHIYRVIDGQKKLEKTVTSRSVTFTNLPEAEYVYEVHSASSRFGESPDAGKVEFTLEWPVVEAPVLTGTVFNANNIRLSWPKVAWANEYRVYEVKGDNREIIYKGTALSTNVYNLSEDTHSYEMTAFNSRFGESAISNRLTEDIIYPVMQPPTASLTLVSTTSARITWNFITYANGYNIYEIIDGKPVLLVENLNNLSYTFTNLTYANHEYYVTSYSNSFGESEKSNNVIAKLIVDTEAPVTTITAPAEWTNQGVEITLTATDDESGVANTYYSLNGNVFTAGTSFTVSKEGINSIAYYSIDKAGNIETKKSHDVKIDLTAPVTASTAPTKWSKEDVEVRLSAEDTLSGAVKTYYSINNTDYKEGTQLAFTDEGVYRISYYSVDIAGNTEGLNIAEVKIDKTAPVITMDLMEEYMLGTELPLSYTASDELSGIISEEIVVTVGDAAAVIENGSSIMLDKPGTYNITVTATDAAGLSTTIRRQVSVYIPVNIEVTPKVIKGNKGIFTVRVELPVGMSSEGFDLKTATVNGVNALASNNGYYNQAKLGQFKFERSDFNWIPSEVIVEFRGYVNGYLVVGQTTVKVQK
ncbi:hypothetical protein AB6A23_02050 [Paenibacillus tarimensis]